MPGNLILQTIIFVVLRFWLSCLFAPLLYRQAYRALNSKSAILMLQSVQNHVNGLFKHQLLGHISSISESVDLGQGLRICIPNTSLEDADAVGSWTTLYEPLSQHSHPSPRSLELCAQFLKNILQGSVDCKRMELSFLLILCSIPRLRVSSFTEAVLSCFA